jgi:hypothetical protein
MHVEYESPQHPSLANKVLGMNIVPHLPVTTEHSIGLAENACPNYIASPLPFSEDTVPLSSHSDDDRVPRSCHGVERRQRSRPTSRGAAGPCYGKLMRAERTKMNTVSSRHVEFAEFAQQIPSSSLWTDPVPTPTPILDGQATSFDLPSVDDCDTCGPWDERDASGFEGDIEPESEVEVAPPYDHPTALRAGARERLTIVVPGGKSEAYVTMAFGRSCSLADNDRINTDHDMSYILPTTNTDTVTPTPSLVGLLTPDAENEERPKTGLKIKIPGPNSAFMLSLRLANSCRVSESDVDIMDDRADGESDTGAASLFTITSLSPAESEYSPPFSFSSSPRSTHESSYRAARIGCSEDSDVTVVQDRRLVLGPSSLLAAPESRVARRAARRGALAPYVNDHRPSSALALTRTNKTHLT